MDIKVDCWMAVKCLSAVMCDAVYSSRICQLNTIQIETKQRIRHLWAGLYITIIAWTGRSSTKLNSHVFFGSDLFDSLHPAINLKLVLLRW